MKLQHYITYCVSHQNTCNYSLSAIDYNNYNDSYDLGKKLHLIPKITFSQYWLKSWNKTFKQTLILAIAKNCFNRYDFCPTYDIAMPIHMVKTALYPIIIKFDEETMQLRWVTYTTKLFNPYKTSVLFVGHRQIVQAEIRRHRLQCLIRLSTVCLQDVLLKFEYEWKSTPNNPEDENGLDHLIKVGNFIQLKRVKEMVTFIIRFVWFCNVIEHRNKIFSPRFFRVIHFRDQGLSLRATLLHCKDHIVAVAKWMNSNKLLEILFCITSIN